MKLLNLAIASIVDANTGNGVNSSFIRQFASATSEYEKRGRRIRANSVIAILGIIKASTEQTIEKFKARAQDRQDIEQVLQLSDHALKDIGLTHADLHDLRSGKTTLKQLGAQRDLNRSQALGDQLTQSLSSVNAQLRGIQSANQAHFESKKCA